MNWYRTAQLRQTIIDLVNEMKEKYPGLVLNVSDLPGKVSIDNLEIPEGMRGNGKGGEIVGRIQEWAGLHGKAVMLHPSSGLGKKDDLRRFYTGLGFNPVSKAERYDPESKFFSPAAEYWYWRKP